ncbi:DUF2262 domain-containing protein [Paraburkholderia sp. SIMBA_009]|uniref:DUF2262 domain-containing protein n=1 Tax=Paraburkholderia tropica TaxID=92647 RepID=UPI002AB6E7A0|nr:DUF2262 domain-containing protein [Paraburkholderia tropica]
MSDPISGLIERQRLIYDKLGCSPQVELSGVVGPNGVAAGKLRGESLWSVTINLEVWRIAGLTVRLDKLTIRRQVTDEQLRLLKEKIRPGLVIAGTIRLADDGVDPPQGLFDRLDPVEPPDPELVLQAKKLAEPRCIEDENLGSLVLDRRVGWFRGRLQLNGTTVILNVAPDKLDAPTEAVSAARVVQSGLQEWHVIASRFATQRLLPVKNQSWLHDAGSAMAAEDFCEKISLKEVTVFSNGKVDFWFDDGDIFGGHSIQVSATVDAGPFDASICG